MAPGWSRREHNYWKGMEDRKSGGTREPSERTVSDGSNELEKYFLIDLNPARALPSGLLVGSHPSRR